MLEIIVAVFLFLSILFAGAAAYLLFINQYLMCSLLRFITKKDYMLIARVSHDRRGIKVKIVLPEAGLIVSDGKQWIIKNNRIYRKNHEHQGSHISEGRVIFEEGIPVMYVDNDTMMPISFAPDKDSEGQDISNISIGWMINQYNKIIAKNKNLEIFLIIAMVFSLLAVGAGYINYQEIQAVKSMIAADSAKITAIHKQIYPMEYYEPSEAQPTRKG